MIWRTKRNALFLVSFFFPRIMLLGQRMDGVQDLVGHLILVEYNNLWKHKFLENTVLSISRGSYGG